MTLPLFDSPRIVTLVRLSGEIARSLGTLGRIAVEGEVHRPNLTRGGWMFFTLRDRAAQIEVKVPASNARRCRAVHGERACVVGSLQWANDRGQVHLVAEEVRPVGVGAIAEMIATTRATLAAEGLLDRPRRPLPLLPALIGVVCGSDAAVRKDIESVVAARFPGYPVEFVETTVSGPAASMSIVEALGVLLELPGVEVVILARGGGDAPSLLPWSTEEVCRAVAASPVPVVSAIGHEGDRPLCDEVADLRCGTPSLAATAVVPSRVELSEALDQRLAAAAALLDAALAASGRRLEAVDTRRALDACVESGAVHLERCGLRLSAVHPGPRLAGCQARLDRREWRRPAWELLGRASGRLEADVRHLRALSPVRTLERGYAVVTGVDGRVVRSAGEVAVGDRIDVRLAAGRVAAEVREVSDG